MNGRMYDANLDGFLSPDNYIQDSYNTQSFNRYGYVWNNPLVLNDPSGELIFTAIAITAAIFAIGNVAAQAIAGNIDNFWDGVGYFFQGAITGALVAGAAMLVSSVPILGPVIKFAATMNAASQSFSVLSGIGYGLITGDWERLGKTRELFLGNFYLDENRTFFGGILQGVSRHSYESLQTNIGIGFRIFEMDWEMLIKFSILEERHL